MTNESINKTEKVFDKLTKRRNMVQIVYRFFLINNNVPKIKQEILDDTQLDNIAEEFKPTLENLIDFIPTAQEVITKYLSATWKWNRIPKMVQAIMCVALFEVKEMKTEPPVVISSSIEMTREYLPSWNEKFVNAVLDKAIEEIMSNEKQDNE